MQTTKRNTDRLSNQKNKTCLALRPEVGEILFWIKICQIFMAPFAHRTLYRQERKTSYQCCLNETGPAGRDETLNLRREPPQGNGQNPRPTFRQYLSFVCEKLHVVVMYSSRLICGRQQKPCGLGSNFSRIKIRHSVRGFYYHDSFNFSCCLINIQFVRLRCV